MTEKRVACFFTGGYTELNAMKAFMRKINGSLKYIQLCPTGQRKSKDSIRKREKTGIDSTHSGLTGDSLINYVLCEVEKKYFQEEEYDAIIIEDDKDSRFLNVQTNGFALFNKAEWDEYKSRIKQSLAERGVRVPVIIFLAAPEVEAWFIADFNNGFGKVYESRIGTNENKYFAVQFKKYIEENVLTDAYVKSIETYGYFNGEYIKLSEKIQEALASKDFMSGYTMTSNDGIQLRYSKRVQGEQMLYDIDPNRICDCCNILFKESFLELQRLM